MFSGPITDITTDPNKLEYRKLCQVPFEWIMNGWSG